MTSSIKVSKHCHGRLFGSLRRKAGRAEVVHLGLQHVKFRFNLAFVTWSQAIVVVSYQDHVMVAQWHTPWLCLSHHDRTVARDGGQWKDFDVEG